MRFSTVMMIRHSIITFLSTDDDGTSPTIQDGAPTNQKQSTLYSGCHAEFHIDFDEITAQSASLYCIVTETPEKMVVAFGITFPPATGKKL